MKATCWSSLSYCCSLDKKCPRRDDVMKALKMSHWEYNKLKTDFDNEIQKTRKYDRNQ